jgi:hypothetical protein
MKTIVTLCMFALLLTACAQQTGEEQSNKGQLVVTVTDAAADMGAVSSIDVTIDSVQVHSVANGWTTLTMDATTVDLLALKATNSNALLANVQVDDGEYDQVRLDISKVVVTDAQGEHEAKLPSKELKVNTNFAVGNNTTTTASFDIVADKSLHMTGNGKYILAPVMQVETRENAQVDVSNKNSVRIVGGSVRSDTRVGMDLDGNIGVNVAVEAGSALDIEGDNIVVVKPTKAVNTTITADSQIGIIS